MADEKKKSTFWSEFKTFIARGNVMDMAVGVVVGSAFTAIVNSLVQGIINPLIGKLMGGLDLSEYKIVLTEATEETAECAIMYGSHTVDYQLPHHRTLRVLRDKNDEQGKGRVREEEGSRRRSASRGRAEAGRTLRRSPPPPRNQRLTQEISLF